MGVPPSYAPYVSRVGGQVDGAAESDGREERALIRGFGRRLLFGASLSLVELGVKRDFCVKPRSQLPCIHAC